MNRNPRDPFDRGFDPFDDPFFKQFEEMQRHMDHVFRDLFGNDNGQPQIFSIEPPNTQHPNNPFNPIEHRKSNNKPDLSQINPNIDTSNNNTDNNNKNKQRTNRSHSQPGLFNVFRHFFEPEYDDHKLSDINPNLSDNGPIMDNDENNNGLIQRDGDPPGFRSPYLPNWNGEEKQIPKSYYRSQSVVISTGPDGKTTKTTTVKDSNGQTTTTTEDLGSNGGNNDVTIFWGNNDNNNDNDNGYQQFPPLFRRTHDPFERFRNRWQKSKWNPFAWINRNKDNDNDNNGNNKNEWFWNNKNNNLNDNKQNEGIKWRSWRDYQNGNNNKPKRDDIVKNDDN